MEEMMQFTGKALRLADIDLPRIGALIGVGEDEIHAVLDVETSGSGFDAHGRPKMLFEPHIFWKELGPGAKRDRAAREGLAYRHWGEQGYPRDSYPRLVQAMKIDTETALRSASWGLGQIMGFNHEAAGYNTALEMVEAFTESEANQLDGMVDFIKATHLDDELRGHEWAAFARGYNGPGYARHGYHKRLAAAYARWAAIRDTPFEIAS
ncbi:peptidoglycan-binding protein [Thioclava sp. NG1]|nr:peptidoglycan-binding protein [Thioclava sp. NG1]